MECQTFTDVVNQCQHCPVVDMYAEDDYSSLMLIASCSQENAVLIHCFCLH